MYCYPERITEELIDTIAGKIKYANILTCPFGIAMTIF